MPLKDNEPRSLKQTPESQTNQHASSQRQYAPWLTRGVWRNMKTLKRYLGPAFLSVASLSALLYFGGERHSIVGARSVTIEGGARLCSVCRVPTKTEAGFTCSPEERIDPRGQREIVAFVYSYEMPNPHPWFVWQKRRTSRDVQVTFEYCRSCEAKLVERLEYWTRNPPSNKEFQGLLRLRKAKQPN